MIEKQVVTSLFSYLCLNTKAVTNLFPRLPENTFHRKAVKQTVLPTIFDNLMVAQQTNTDINQ